VAVVVWTEDMVPRGANHGRKIFVKLAAVGKDLAGSYLRVIGVLRFSALLKREPRTPAPYDLRHTCGAVVALPALHAGVANNAGQNAFKSWRRLVWCGFRLSLRLAERHDESIERAASASAGKAALDVPIVGVGKGRSWNK
jgi:hypothetical protein